MKITLNELSGSLGDLGTLMYTSLLGLALVRSEAANPRTWGPD